MLLASALGVGALALALQSRDLRDASAIEMRHDLRAQMDMDEDPYEADLEPQQANWTTQPLKGQHYGREPFKRNMPVAPLRAPSRVTEETQLEMNDAYKEYMRQMIEDTEWDAPPLQGERASLWPDRERRRMPIINHPNSVYSVLRVPPESEAIAPVGPLPKPEGVVAVNWTALESDDPNVWMAATRRYAAE